VEFVAVTVISSPLFHCHVVYPSPSAVYPRVDVLEVLLTPISPISNGVRDPSFVTVSSTLHDPKHIALNNITVGVVNIFEILIFQLC